MKKKYIVLVGNEVYHPDSHLNTEKRFETLKEARTESSDYWKAAIYRENEDGTLTELKRGKFKGV